MKRILILALALVMCASLVCNVFATANGFVPSISFKEEPDIVPIEPPSDGGRPILGPVYDEETKEEISQILDGCLVITPISEVHTSTEIPPEAAEELLRVYHELTAGTMDTQLSIRFSEDSQKSANIASFSLVSETLWGVSTAGSK